MKTGKKHKTEVVDACYNISKETATTVVTGGAMYLIEKFQD
jgi:hypothetical protein